MVAKVLPNIEPLRKITIIPRGMALGYTKTLTEDKYLPTRSQFNDELALLFGGRVAEELIFNEMTVGAADDIERATKLARRMVTDYGMSDKLGPRTFGRKEELVFLGREISEQRDYSEKMAKMIDDEVNRILQEAYAQHAILSFTDVGLVLSQSPTRISQLVRRYRQHHPSEFIPHCGSVLDMGSTQTHKREAVLLYLQGHLTSEIARQIQHAPEDVDRYLYDYQRVIELAEEGKSTSQSSFVTGLRPHLVREYTTLWREIKALKETESASETLDKEKEKDAPDEQG